MSLASRFIALCCAISVHFAAFGACTTHFYNKSNYPWTVSHFDGTNTNLVVPANTTVDLSWKYTTRVTVSATIASRSFAREYRVVRGPSGCFTIANQNLNGFAIVNRPSVSDITTCTGDCK